MTLETFKFFGKVTSDMSIFQKTKQSPMTTMWDSENLTHNGPSSRQQQPATQQQTASYNMCPACYDMMTRENGLNDEKYFSPSFP